MDCPRIFPISSVTMRATTSLGPPAGEGTITVMGRDGQVCAVAPSGTANRLRAAMQSSFFNMIDDRLSNSLRGHVLAQHRLRVMRLIAAASGLPFQFSLMQLLRIFLRLAPHVRLMHFCKSRGEGLTSEQHSTSVPKLIAEEYRPTDRSCAR